MVRLIIGQEEQDEKWWSIKLIIKIVWFILKIDRYKVLHCGGLYYQKYWKKYFNINPISLVFFLY